MHIFAECFYVLCRYIDWHSDKCRGAIVVSGWHSYGYCHSDEWRSDDCHGTVFISKRDSATVILLHTLLLSVIILGVILMSAVARLWATVMSNGILISILSLSNIVLRFYCVSKKSVKISKFTPL